MKVFYPELYWLSLLAIPFLLGQFFLYFYRKKKILNFSDPHVIPKLLTARSSLLTLIKIAGWTLCWLLLTFALMNPYGNIRYPSLNTEEKENNQEIIFLVDTSASMGVLDGEDGASRLNAAKTILEDLLTHFKGETLSLYAFTSQLTTIVPSTLDYVYTRLAIHTLVLNEGDVGGTSIGNAFDELREKIIPGKQSTILLFSDGGDNALEVAKNKDQAEKDLIDHLPKGNAIHIYTIGMGGKEKKIIPHVTFQGQPVYSQLNFELLEKIAKMGNGKYFQAADWSSWNLANSIFKEIAFSRSLSSEQNDRKVSPVKSEEELYDLYFQIPLGLSIFIILILLLVPDIYTLACLLFFFSITSINGNESIQEYTIQGESYFEARDYQKALDVYQKLLTLPLKEWQIHRAAYNLGTVYLAKGDSIKAIRSFNTLNPTDLSVPRFGKNLFLNEGIALSLFSQSPFMQTNGSFNGQIYLIQEGLSAFERAEKIACKNTQTCLLPRVKEWKEASVRSFIELTKKQRSYWLKEQNESFVATFLYFQIEQLRNKLNAVKNEKLLSYFVLQLKNLLPLWDHLKKMANNQVGHSSITFEKAGEFLEKNDKKNAIKTLNESLEKLVPSIYHPPIEQADVLFSMMSLNNTISVLKKLIEKLKESHSDQWKDVIGILEKSQLSFQANKRSEGAFFFLASNSLFSSLYHRENTPKAILKKSLDIADQNLNVFALSTSISDDHDARIALTKSQESLIAYASRFFPAVIALQSDNYQNAKDPNIQCQQFPWDQVVPLVGSGRDFLKLALPLTDAFDKEEAIQAQMAAIQDWKQAMNILMQPPPKPAPSNQQEWQEMVRQAQEMLLDDQTPQPQVIREMHTW